MKSKSKLKTRLIRLFKGKQGGAVPTAIKVLTAVVCGAIIMTGLYGVVTSVVLPASSDKVISMFAYEGNGAGGGSGDGSYEGGTGGSLSNNLFDFKTAEFGYYDTSGNLVDSTTLMHSDFIQVEYGKTYKISVSGTIHPYIVTFNENYEIIDSYKSTSSSEDNRDKYITIDDSSVKFLVVNIAEWDKEHYYVCEVDENKIPNRTMRVGFLGDSITAGTFTDSDTKRQRSTIFDYQRNLSSELSFLNYDYGYPSSPIAPSNNGSMPSFVERAEKMRSDLDMVFVMGGINDFFCGTLPFGSISDETTDTFIGSCNVLLENLSSKYQNKKIVFLTPLTAKLALNDATNAASGKTLDEYVEAIKEVCSLYENVTVIDTYAWSESNLDPLDTNLVSDGTHPSIEGYSKLSDFIYDELIRLGLF